MARRYVRQRPTFRSNEDLNFLACLSLPWYPIKKSVLTKGE